MALKKIVTALAAGGMAAALLFVSRMEAGMAERVSGDASRGRDLFSRVWSEDIPRGPENTNFGGLGPLYNARSCALCHIDGGRGHTPEANWPDGDALSMVFRLYRIAPGGDASSRDLLRPDPVYGWQLQDLAVPGAAFEGKIHIDYSEATFRFPDGEQAALQTPAYTIDHLNSGPLDADTFISPRIAPPLYGVGYLASTGARFGWRADSPTLDAQIALALANDMGLTNPLPGNSHNDCTLSRPACGSSGEQPPAAEVTAGMMADLEAYLASIPEPAQKKAGDGAGTAGEKLFYWAGCASCHVAHPAGLEAAIEPYSDLRLHEMGDGLADRTLDGKVGLRVWRTPPLWGVKAGSKRDGTLSLLHDGRARSLQEAILWHGGDASKARQAFTSLPKERRETLLEFVGSL